jgi:hypothetical protein
MNSAVLVAIFTALGGILSLVVKSFLNRDRRRMSGTEQLSDTALEQLAAMRKEVNEYRAEVNAFRRALRAHEVWDRKVIRTLAAQGIEVEPAPDLWAF